jgi:cytoskeletal protein CcmA (bactofilin family)
MSDLLRPEGKGAGDSWRAVRVSLGPDAEVSGRLSFTTATRIEGRMRGEVRTSDLLVVGPQAVVHATVLADELVVLGEIHGDVKEARRVEIRGGGKLIGDVETGTFVVDEGGFFEGNCRMLPAVSEDGSRDSG